MRGAFIGIGVSLACLWILHFMRNAECARFSSDIKEIRAIIAQQPQERHFSRTVDTTYYYRTSGRDTVLYIQYR